MTVKYKDIVAGDYIADFVIDGKIIVEIKAVSRLTSRHQAQALNYLAATGYQLSILLNSVPRLCNNAESFGKKQKEIRDN